MVGEPEVQFNPSVFPPPLYFIIFAGASLPWSGLPGSTHCADCKCMSSPSFERSVVWERERGLREGTVGTDLSPSPCSLGEACIPGVNTEAS